MPSERRLRPPRLAHGDVFRILVLLVLFAAVLALGVFTDVFDELTPDKVHAALRRAGPLAPALYLAGFLVRPLALVPLTLWLFAGGIAFGWTRGAALAFVGVNLGAAAVFLAARSLGREYLTRFLGKRLGRWRKPPVSWGARLVLSLQLLPFMHHDVLNVAAGCSRIPYWRFLLGSFLGTLPGIVIYTYAGSVLMAPGSKRFYVVFLALAMLSLLSVAGARLLRQQEEEDALEEEPETSGEATRCPGPGADEALEPSATSRLRR